MIANDRLKIAVVDDEKDLLDLYQAELEDFGFHAETYAFPEKAFEAIQSGKFDIVISDVRMPKLTGLDLLKKLQDTIPEVPTFLFVTGYSQYNRKEMLETGAKEVFYKPIDISEIVDWIKNNHPQAGS